MGLEYRVSGFDHPLSRPMESFSALMPMTCYLPALFSIFSNTDRVASNPQTAPNETGFSQRLIEYLALRGSTTFFLQAVSGSHVHVEVLNQFVEHRSDKGDILYRHSRLYAGQPCNIVLVAQSAIQLSLLTSSQKQSLIDCEEGIGKLLDPDNRGWLEKNDIHTLRVDAPRSLQTRLDWAISRHFELKFRGMHCGEIRETLNNESLERA
jgi:chorismate-pyruvate lyase